MDKKVLLAYLWIFVVLNYIFCDVFTLFHAPDLNNLITGQVGEIRLTENFLLAFAIIMEIAMVMIILSRVLAKAYSRWLNVVAGIFFTLLQAGTLLDGDFTKHYLFFSMVEIVATAYIAVLAWNWKISKEY